MADTSAYLESRDRAARSATDFPVASANRGHAKAFSSVRGRRRGAGPASEATEWIFELGSRVGVARTGPAARWLLTLALVGTLASPALAQEREHHRHHRHHGAAAAPEASAVDEVAPSAQEAPPERATETADRSTTLAAQDAAEPAAPIASATVAMDAASADDSDEIGDGPEAERGDEAEADPMLRIRLSVGAGRVEEAKAHDQSAYGGFAAGIDAFPAAGLMLSLEAGADYYDRRYQTNRAALGSNGLLSVPEREHRVRGRLRIGYDVLDAAGVARRAGTLTPYVMASLDEFVNDPLPQTLFYVGGGLEGMARIADQLRLSADLHYGYAVSNNHPDVQNELLFGSIKGVLGYGGGLSLVLPPHALLGVRYRGEWIANDHSRRFVNGAELTLGFEL